MHDNGATELLSDADCPLAVRLKLGPSEVCCLVLHTLYTHTFTLVVVIASYIQVQYCIV